MKATNQWDVWSKFYAIHPVTPFTSFESLDLLLFRYNIKGDVPLLKLDFFQGSFINYNVREKAK